MASNSKHRTKYIVKTKKQKTSFPKQYVENADLNNSALTKSMTTRK